MPSKEEFIAMFKSEAEDLVTKLDKELVAFEKEPTQIELAKNLNVVAHTLKGAARVFGFHGIQEITHKVEEIFSRVQQQELAFSSVRADWIFRGLDCIRAILKDGSESHQKEAADICQGLERCLSGRPGGPEKVAPGKEETKVEKQMTPEHEPLGPVSSPPMDTLAGPSLSDAGGLTEKLFQGPAKPSGTAEEYIRVPISRVNKLLNLVGEMVINKMKTSTKIAQLKNLAHLAKEIQGMVSALAETIKMELPYADGQLTKKIERCYANLQQFRQGSVRLLDNLVAEAFHLDPVIDELQANMKEIRMLPLGTIFEGFPRMVRDIASEKGKEVNLEITGEKTELDKKILEGIKAPLMHLLRNAVDHGIEEPDVRAALGKPKAGTVKLTAEHEAGNVVIRIEDDGRGLDIDQIQQTALRKHFVTQETLQKMTEKEILNIIFMNGYSTSSIITDISGRGIGMDIARRNIEALKGQIFIQSEPGKGLKVTLILPLTIAIIQVLLLKLCGKTFAVPLTAITESLQVTMSEISTLDGKMAIQVRDRIIPLVNMSDVLGLPPQPVEEDAPPPSSEISIVVVSSLDKQIGFIVDEVVGEEEVFIKNLGEHLGKVKNISGATILGTGEVLPILDVEDLLANSRLSHPAVLGKMVQPGEKRKERRILVVDDVLSTRELERSILESKGFNVSVAIDGVDGLEKASQAPYDLIVTDIEMPRMGGFEFCQNLKMNDLFKDIPVVIVTALEKEEDKRRGIDVGASAYIVKTSFDQTNLVDTIERLIG